MGSYPARAAPPFNLPAAIVTRPQSPCAKSVRPRPRRPAFSIFQPPPVNPPTCPFGPCPGPIAGLRYLFSRLVPMRD